MKKLRVCVDARVAEGRAGGIEQVIIGLASGLSSLEGDCEEYFFLTLQGADQWLRPYVAGPCRVIAVPPDPRYRDGADLVGLALMAALQRLGLGRGNALLRLFRRDEVLAGLDCDLVHFPRQKAFLTDRATLYHPHDLQHVHLPQYFSLTERAVRELRYRSFCARAAMVPVAATWVKEDLVRHYGLSGDKVAVVPLAPPLAAYPVPGPADLARTRGRLVLPERFALYAAQTWPHKNHLKLLEAVALLRDRRGISVPLVCPGGRNAFFPVVEARVAELDLQGLVTFPGFVTPLELQSLYRLARLVVVPTKFEAGSFLIFEAFLAGTPVACSRVTSLPRQADGAALLFDPDRPEEIAECMERLWHDDALCGELVARGRDRVAQFSWPRTARLFRAHYRRLAGQPLGAEDRALIADAPLV
jgi:glycosyltransferase involved in cell wall biosynthesis